MTGSGNETNGDMQLDRRSVLAGTGALTGLATVGAGGVPARRPPVDDHDDGTGDEEAEAGADDATVRVAHLSPDAPDVDVFVDGNEVFSGVAFRSVSGRLELAADTYTVTITAADDPDTVAFEGRVDLAADTDYTVAAIGELSEDTFRPALLVDDLDDLPEQVATVRVFHASPDAPAVDVTVDDDDVLANDVAFGDSWFYRFVRAGTRRVQVRPESRFNDADPVLETDVSIEGGRVYTVFAAGYLSPDDEPTGEAFGLVPAVDGDPPASDPARLRVAHASPDAPAVDVLVDGTAVLEGVSFGTITGRLEVQPGTYTVAITAAGDPETVVFEHEVTVDAGAAYTVTAFGELSEDAVRATTLVDDLDADRGAANVRVFHASPDAPAVDVTVNDAAATLVDALAFGTDSGYAEVHPGRYELEVRPDSERNDNPFDADFDAVLRPGRNYTVIASGYFTAGDEPTDEGFGFLSAIDAGPGH